jgi:hypothetical protein
MQAMRSALLGQDALGSVLFYKMPCRVLTPPKLSAVKRVNTKSSGDSASVPVTRPALELAEEDDEVGRGLFKGDHNARISRAGLRKRTGFYLAVLREGEVAAGDSIEFTERQEEGVTI